MKSKLVYVGVLAGFLLIAFAVAMLIHTAEPEGPSARPVAASSEALVRMHSPVMGRPEAKVTIVEFLDPACGTCAAFYLPVKELVSQQPDDLRLVLRYAPFHPGVDQVIALIEAARRQDKLWPALEALLATQDRWTPNHRPDAGEARRVLAEIGLDMDKLVADAADPAIAALIAQDAADARTLGVEKTPEFFVNGRPLPSFGFRQLTALIAEDLAGK